ncbi:MAG: hypothetical protein J1F27_01685 [Prevotellaceae bacterium]|nr:hypothetical protein [Prevotellaceae bacterium]
MKKIDEKWFKKCQEIMDFIVENKRNPSKHYIDERKKYHNWIKYNKKLLNAGKFNPERMEMYTEFLKLRDRYKRPNQWQKKFDEEN